MIDKIIDLDERKVENNSISNIKQEEKNDITEEEKVKINGIFDILSDGETYATYRIYIVRENDTIESIIQKYGVNKNMLENYNDLKEIKIGDKIIIPSNEI